MVQIQKKSWLQRFFSLATETVKWYNAQNDMVVLDKNDMLQLAEELNQ